MGSANKQVLVVEDDVSLRKAMAGALRHEGYVVHEVGNGNEADSQVRSLKPDLILLDVMLPGRTGLDICQSLKSDKDLKSIPIIMMTCLTNESKHDDSYWQKETGADDFITKPFPLGELIRRVNRILA